MRWRERRDAFRALLEGETCVFPASVFDPLSARAAHDLGFESMMLAGSVASLCVLGAPDLVVLTLSEFAGLALRINRAGSLPLLVDADHGYGDALNVMRTVDELEIAGVAALTIEDTDLPGRFGAVGPRLLSVDEGVGKMRAALAARRDPGLVIFARTSAPAFTNFEDALARARAYAATGVDGIFLVGLKTPDEVEAIADAVRLPIALGALAPALGDRAHLGACGVRVALQGHAPAMAAIQAARAILQALREGTPPGALRGLPTPALMRDLTRAQDYEAAIEAYLRP